MEHHFLLTDSNDLAEATAFYEGLSRALEAGLSHFRAEINSLVIWNLLVGKMRLANKVHAFVNSICDLYLSEFVKGFILVNRKNNFIVHDLTY